MSCAARVTADTPMSAFTMADGTAGSFAVDAPHGVVWFVRSPSAGLSVVLASAPFPPGEFATSFTDLHTITTATPSALSTQGLAIDGAGNIWWAVHDSVAGQDTLYHVTAGGGFSTLYSAPAGYLIIGLGYSPSEHAIYAGVRRQTPSILDRLERIPVDGSTVTTVIADLSNGTTYALGIGQVFFIGAHVFVQLIDTVTSLYTHARWNGAAASWGPTPFGATVDLEVGDGLLNLDGTSAEVKMDDAFAVTPVACTDYANAVIVAFTATHDKSYLLRENVAFTEGAWWVVPGAPPSSVQTNWVIGSQRRVTV